MSGTQDINDRLESAAVKAEGASEIFKQVANGGANAYVSTESGPVPSIAEWQRLHAASLGSVPAIQQLLADLQSQSEPTKGASLIGWDGRSLASTLKVVKVANLPTNGDVSDALQTFFDNLDGYRGRVPPGYYKVNRQINLPADVDVDITGVTFDFSDALVIDFPDLVMLKVANGLLTALPAFATATTVGSYTTPPFTSAHGLIPGDLIVMHDDTPSSYSAWRSNYYQGQMAIVRSLNGLQANLTSAILATLPTSTKIYRMTPATPTIIGGTIVMPKAGVFIAGVMTDISKIPRMRNVRVLNASGGGIIFQRSYGWSAEGCAVYSDRDGVAADNYGLVISNCQDGEAVGGQFHTRRHGVTMGGTDLPGSVPTRFCTVRGASISSWDIQGADMHGNVEHCQYLDNIMLNGVTISGNHNTVRGGKIFAPANAATGNGVAVSINEMRGTSFTFEGFSIIALGDPSTSTRGVIDCGGNNNSMTSATILGGVMAFRNIEMSAPNARIPLKIRNTGSTASGREIDISNVRCNDSPVTRVSNAVIQNASGTPFDRVSFDLTFPNLGAPAGTTIDAVRVSGMVEDDSTTVLTTATVFQDVPVLYKRRFPKAPIVKLSKNQSAAGVNIFCDPLNVGTDGFTARIFTTGSNMTAGVSVRLMWTASLNE